MRIKTKILIPAITLTLLIAAAILISNIFLFKGFVDDETMEKASYAAKAAANNLQFLKAEAKTASISMAKDPSIIQAAEAGDRERLLAYARSLQEEMKIDFCAVTDPDGNVIIRTHAPEQFGDSIASQINVRTAMYGKSLTTIEAGSFIRLAVRTGTPIINRKGAVVGTVSVGYRLDTDRFVDSIKEITGYEISVVSGNERIATTLVNEDGTRAIGKKAGSNTGKNTSKENSHSEEVDILSRLAVANYIPVNNPANQTIGIIYIGQYVDEGVKTIQAFVQGTLIITFLMLVVFTMIILFIIGRIVQPIHTMTKAAAALAAGDTEIDIRVNTKDEMRTLADAFNSMIENTRRQIRIVESIAEGEDAVSLQIRSDKDIMNHALEKLYTTIQIQSSEQKKMIEEINRRDQLLQTVNKSADILLRSEPQNFENTLYSCMSMMTQVVAADHMYIYKNYTENDKLFCKRIYQWSENIRSFRDSDQAVNISYDDRIPESKRILSSGDCVHGLVEDMKNPDQATYREREIQSILLIPVFIHNEFWGFVGFDNGHSEQLFTENQESIVQSGSLLIANALLRNEYVTNIREASLKLEAALKEAENANKTKSDFLANMSHEMRTPLNAVIGLSKVTLDNSDLDGACKENLEKIFDSGSTLLSIVNDILDISKIQSGNFVIIPDQYDVSGMINDAIVQNVLRIGSKPIRFILDLPKNIPAYLIGDDLRVKQIMNNLLSNAFKYTEGGSVTFSLVCERDEDNVWMTISIKDTGIGIKQENLEQLFDNYTQFGATTYHQADGTGLGLAITRKLAEMMDGNISVTSKYGEGSKFVVKIRQKHVNEEVIDDEALENLRNFKYSSGKLRYRVQKKYVQMPYANVLVVDDNKTNLDVARGLMKPYGMHIDSALNGPDAIRAVKEKKVKYHAIFMDHMMPGMDGIEATRIIREEIGTEYAKTVPIIAFTANALVGNEEMFLTKGFQGFVSKPIDTVKLDAVINKWVRDKDYEKEFFGSESPVREISGEDGKDNEPGIPAIEGIDSQEGIRNSGSKERFIRLLGNFYKIIDLKTDKIEQCLADGKIKDIIIEAHALKSTAKTIGAKELSESFARLETYGDKGDTDKLEEEVPVALNQFKSFRSGLKPFGEVPEEKKKTASQKELILLLQKIKTAIDVFDLDRADEALDQLEHLWVPEECRTGVKQLGAYIADVAMEEIMETAEELIDRLEKMPGNTE